MDLPSRQHHFRGPCRQQNWSFRNTVINYITKTPSNSKAWEKLIQSCKYFFAKHPIIVVECLDLHQKCVASADRLQKLIPSNNVSYKLWITRQMIHSSCFKDPKYVSSIIPQIYRCDATKLFLFDQILSYKEFLFLSGNVEVLHLGFGVKNEDGTVVALEKLVKTLVNLKKISGEIDPFCSCITKNTVKKLLEVPHFLKLYKFVFIGLPETFDVDAIFAYLKKNMHTEFQIYFADSVSDEYEVRLENIVDEILLTETHDYKPPLISFDGLHDEKYRKMYYLYKRTSGF